MSARITSVKSIKSADPAEFRATGLPITRDLALAYILSLSIASLMTFASVIGVVYQKAIYSTDDLLLAFVPNDVFNLVVGLPILFGSIWFARRGAVIGLLCLPGALFYELYIYIPYVVGVPISMLTLLYAVLVALSAYTMI